MAATLTFAVPVSWDNTRTYEINTIVFIGKKAYTAVQDVPTGVAIDNTSYWVETGIHDSDLTDLQTALTALQGDVSQNTSDISDNAADIVTLGNNLTTVSNNLASATADLAAATQRLDNIMITLYTPVVQQSNS